MILVVDALHIERLTGELKRAGSREIGGVLVGEHLDGDRFALLDFSVQRRGGGRAHFKRDPAKAARFVRKAIAKSGGDANRVNYLGEWHSHPNCSALPSGIDRLQMREIVEDPEASAHFSVLMIVGLVGRCFEMSMTLFRPGTLEVPVTLEFTGIGGVRIASPTHDFDSTPKEVMEQSDA
jgi:[CysO sulfur-carrier protein]-S-L-cysteine hydrolase